MQLAWLKLNEEKAFKINSKKKKVFDTLAVIQNLYFCVVILLKGGF